MQVSTEPPRHAGRPRSQRQLRVGEEIRHGLADVLMRRELRDPDLPDPPPTITEVRISPDLKNATVFFAPLGGAADDAARKTVAAALARATPFLRRHLAAVTRLRQVPSLSFRYDDAFDTAGRISALIHRSRPAAMEDDG